METRGYVWCSLGFTTANPHPWCRAGLTSRFAQDLEHAIESLKREVAQEHNSLEKRHC